MLELKLLGLPKLFFEGQELDAPGSKALALLCYLACQSEAVHRKALAELLWNTTSTTSVRVALSELRTLKGAEQWLFSDGQLVSLDAKTDVHALEQCLSLGDYAQALALWTETPDPQFLRGLEVKKAAEFDDWVAVMRSQLNEQHTEILQGQLELFEQDKQFDAALDLARQILFKDPLNEDMHRTIMRLEHARGNSDGALKQFESLKQSLKTELGVEPLAETFALLQEIERATISSGKTAVILSELSSIPALPDKLIGRDDLLAELNETLKTNKRILLHGFGGTGKSALAASFAKQWLETNRGSVLWLEAGDDSAESLFDAIAKAFNAQNQVNQTANPSSTLKSLLSKNTSLFILDDAWNSYALSKLQDALPEQLGFIVTARLRHTKLKRLDVGRLKREDALAFLSDQAKQALSDNKEANKLCALLGDHPLAVRIAGLTLAAENLSAKDLLNRIKDNPHSMKTPEEFSEEGRESVASLLASTAKTLSDPAYEALLGCGSLYSTSTTPELLALALRRDEEATENALIELQKRGLSDRQTRAGSDLVSYKLHDLVFSFAKANTNLRASTLMQAVKSFLTKHQRDFDVLDIDIANILGSTQTAQYESPELFIKIMSQLCVGDAYYLARGHSLASLRLLIKASELAEALDYLEDAHFLFARLGDGYRVLYGDYNKALASYRKALDLAQRINNKARKATLYSLIAITRFEQNHEDFNCYFDKAYAIASSEKDDFLLSNILQHRGYVAGHQGNWELTQELSKEAIEVVNRLALQHPNESSDINYRLFFSLLNLGEAERKLGNFDQALIVRTQALNLALNEQNQLWAAYAFQELGEMYHDVDNKALALENFKNALKLYEENNAFADMEQIKSFLASNAYQTI